MKNPFKYGGIVKGEDFADREGEFSSLVRDMKDRQKIFLISPRRYGKTSLIKRVLSALAGEGFYTVYLDLYKVASFHKLLEKYSREIAMAVEGRLERAVNFVSEALPRLRPKVTIDLEGKPSLGIERVVSRRETMDLLDEVFGLPQKVAEKRKRGIVIAFDEFQEIANFGGESIEKTMRAHIQHHGDVGYIFAGSKRHLSNDMIHSGGRAFYKIGRAVYLSKIPRPEFAEFIRHKFEATGYGIENEVVERILNLTEDFPYNAQFLCHELWDMFSDSKTVKTSDVKVGLKKILVEQTPFYLSVFDNLTLQQRNVLQAIANHGGERIFSEEVMNIVGIGPASSLQTALKLLMKKEILYKDKGVYLFEDVFFKEWIRHEMT